MNWNVKDDAVALVDIFLCKVLLDKSLDVSGGIKKCQNFLCEPSKILFMDYIWRSKNVFFCLHSIVSICGYFLEYK